MKKILTVLALLLIFSAACFMAACGETKSYTITFLNHDGTSLQSISVKEGEIPEYKGATPAKQSTAEYSYVFDGWDFELTAAKKAAVYTAKFKESKRSYTITFKNEDGEVLQSTPVEYGEIPACASTPAKQSTVQNDYTFAGWTPALIAVTGEATYTATFTPKPIEVVKYESGEGTEESPYTIKTPDQLRLLATEVNEGNKYEGTYFVLNANINLGSEEWTPIGNRFNWFAGSFDGNNHKISNFRISNLVDNSDLGLFGDVDSGTIKNLGVEDFVIDISPKEGGFLHVGGLAGYSVFETIFNCHTRGSINLNGTYVAAGGLIGYNSTCVITNCYAICDVTVAASENALAGGLIATSGGSYNGEELLLIESVITNCYATGNVRAQTLGTGGYVIAGGLISHSGTTEITNCYATGNVRAQTLGDFSRAYAGGLVGDHFGSTTNCYATGNVSATSSNYPACAGGLVGFNDSGTITNCYATGDASATSSSSSNYAYAGGLIGDSYYGTIQNCYCYENQIFYRKIDTDEYDTATNDEGSPCTLDELNSQSFYIDTLGWNKDIWDFSDLDFENGKFPTLKI